MRNVLTIIVSVFFASHLSAGKIKREKIKTGYQPYDITRIESHAQKLQAELTDRIDYADKLEKMLRKTSSIIQDLQHTTQTRRVSLTEQIARDKAFTKSRNLALIAQGTSELSNYDQWIINNILFQNLLEHMLRSNVEHQRELESRLLELALDPAKLLDDSDDSKEE